MRRAFISLAQSLSCSGVKSRYLNGLGSSGLDLSSRLTRLDAQLKPFRQMTAPLKAPLALAGTLGPYSLSKTRRPLVTQPVPRRVVVINARRHEHHCNRRINMNKPFSLKLNPTGKLLGLGSTVLCLRSRGWSRPGVKPCLNELGLRRVHRFSGR